MKDILKFFDGTYDGDDTLADAIERHSEKSPTVVHVPLSDDEIEVRTEARKIREDAWESIISREYKDKKEVAMMLQEVFDEMESSLTELVERSLEKESKVQSDVDVLLAKREKHLLANSIVKIKSWEHLLEMGSLDELGNIKLEDAYFTRSMKHLCGCSLTLDEYAMYDGWMFESSMCDSIDYWAATEDEEIDEGGEEAFCTELEDEGVSDEGFDLSNATVTIKSWGDMLSIGSMDSDGDIFLGFNEAYFIESMRYLCNQTIVLDEEGYYNDWVISPAMCSKIEYSKPYFAKTTDEYGSSPRYDTTELESGMVIKDGYGQVARVSMGTRFGDLLLYKNGTWNELSELEQHWDKGEHMDYGLCKVYSPDSVISVLNESWDLDRDYNLVWKKEDLEIEEKVKMSLEDIEGKLGYKIDLI